MFPANPSQRRRLVVIKPDVAVLVAVMKPRMLRRLRKSGYRIAVAIVVQSIVKRVGNQLGALQVLRGPARQQHKLRQRRLIDRRRVAQNLVVGIGDTAWGTTAKGLVGNRESQRGCLFGGHRGELDVVQLNRGPGGSLASLVTTSKSRCVSTISGVQLNEVVFNASVTVVHVDGMGAVNAASCIRPRQIEPGPVGRPDLERDARRPGQVVSVAVLQPKPFLGSSIAMPAQLPVGCAAMLMLMTVPCTWSRAVEVGGQARSPWRPASTQPRSA